MIASTMIPKKLLLFANRTASLILWRRVSGSCRSVGESAPCALAVREIPQYEAKKTASGCALRVGVNGERRQGQRKRQYKIG